MDGDNQWNIAQGGKPGETPGVLGMNDVRLKLPHACRRTEEKIVRYCASSPLLRSAKVVRLWGWVVKQGKSKGSELHDAFPAENITGNMRMPGSISTGRFSGKMTQTSWPRLRRCSAMFLV